MSFYVQILVPPNFGWCPLTSFALATALLTTLDKIGYLTLDDLLVENKETVLSWRKI